MSMLQHREKGRRGEGFTMEVLLLSWHDFIIPIEQRGFHYSLANWWRRSLSRSFLGYGSLPSGSLLYPLSGTHDKIAAPLLGTQFPLIALGPGHASL